MNTVPTYHTPDEVNKKAIESEEMKNAMVSSKNDTSTISVFSNVENFKNALFMAEQIAKSDIIPASFKNKPENCLVALEMSNRMKMPVMQIFQNLYVIQGKPCWSSSFIISCIMSNIKILFSKIYFC